METLLQSLRMVQGKADGPGLNQKEPFGLRHLLTALAQVRAEHRPGRSLVQNTERAWSKPEKGPLDK